MAVTPVKADIENARRIWEKLHQYELMALHDYRNRNTSKAVINRSDDIWNLQASKTLAVEFPACASAAQNLSQMVSSTYHDSRQGRIPVDWFYFSPRYETLRSRCIAALGLNDDNYPLPFWFGG